MACKSCHSLNQMTFDSKIFAHFTSFGVANRSVTLRPKLTICVDCGRAVLHLPKDQLKLLTDSVPKRCRKWSHKVCDDSPRDSLWAEGIATD